jgi:hypothetical protein
MWRCGLHFGKLAFEACADEDALGLIFCRHWVGDGPGRFLDGAIDRPPAGAPAFATLASALEGLG